MTLPFDYSRCVPTGCTLKANCARYNAPAEPVSVVPRWGGVADFSVHLTAGKDGPECPYFRRVE